MTARTIETKAIISAQDNTGAAFASALQHMRKLDEAVERQQAHMKAAFDAEKTANAAAREQDRAARLQDREARQRRAEERQERRDELNHLREVRKLKMEQEHHGFRRYVAQTAATAVAAHSVVEVIGETVRAGAERQHVRVGMANAGMSPEEIKRAEDAAVAASHGAPNMSISEIMELHKEARSAVQHPEEAFALLPQLAKAASVLKGMGAQNANIADIVKAGESLGLMNDPKRFEKYLDSQVRAMNVMGKTIDPTQIYEAAKYSKAAGATLSDDFLNLVLPSLIQEMHGSSAGEALAKLNSTLRGGLQHRHLPVEKLNELGMLEDPSKIKRSKTGQIMGYSGKVVGDALIAEHPDQFAKIFNDHMEAHGIKNFDDKVKTLYETLPGTAGNVIRILIQQMATLEQHRKNYLAAPGLDDAAIAQLRDASLAVKNLAASLNDLGAAVTGPAMETAGSTLSSIADGIRAVAAAAHRHPIVAMTGGAAAGAGALGGAGYMAYKLSTGFGLTTSASLLDAAALNLSAAAAKLETAGLVGASEGALGSAAKVGAKTGLGWAGLGAAATNPVVVGGLATIGLALLGLKSYQDGNPGEFRGAGGRGRYWHYPDEGRVINYTPPGRGRSSSWDLVIPDGSGRSGEQPTRPLTPIGPRAGLPSLASLSPTVDLKFDQPGPLRFEFIVTASSTLLQVERAAQQATVQLKARADTGPGGLGETHTGQ